MPIDEVVNEEKEEVVDPTWYEEDAPDIEPVTEAAEEVVEESEESTEGPEVVEEDDSDGLDDHTRGILRDLIKQRDRAQRAEWELQQERLEKQRILEAAEAAAKPSEEDLTPWERQEREISDLKRMLVEREQQDEYRRQAQRAYEATEHVKRTYDKQHEELEKEQPDLNDAVGYILNLQYQELIERGATDQQAQDLLKFHNGREMFQMIANGGNFAKAVYEKAKRYGYQPKSVEKPASPAAPARTRTVSPSLSKIPGSSKPSTRPGSDDFLDQVKKVAADIHNPSRFEELMRRES